MNEFMKLARDAQIVLGAALLYVIISFLNWQQVSVGPYTVGLSEWSGIGYLAAIIGYVVAAAALFHTFTDFGHLTAVAIGLACYPLVRAKTGRSVDAPHSQELARSFSRTS